MSWITLLWSMTPHYASRLLGISAGLVQAAPGLGEFAIFVQRLLRRELIAEFELDSMHAQTAAQYGAHRAMGASAAVDAARVDCMVRASLSARRRLWLAWSVSGLRTLALFLNFLLPQILTFGKSRLSRHPRGGEERRCRHGRVRTPGLWLAN